MKETTKLAVESIPVTDIQTMHRCDINQHMHIIITLKKVKHVTS